MIRYVVVDSISELTEEQKNSWIFCGSHGGRNAALHALTYHPTGVIFNDAGIGKGNAGIAGLKLCEQHQIPAACVACSSARIGDGKDTLKHGIVSRANKMARNIGINKGTKAIEILSMINLS